MNATSYDELLYPSYSNSDSSTDHLYTLAKLFGLQAQNPRTAKVLELGCSNGGNLHAQAMKHPKASYLGFDFSAKQIDFGKQQIKELGIKNVELQQKNIMDITAKDGKFDYIIAHGVYSWVSEEVKTKLLSVCNENLTDNGVVYISYNTLPGWNMTRTIRDLMIFHANKFTDIPTKIQQARAFLSFLAKSLEKDHSSHATLLAKEADYLSKKSDSYLYHEHLEDHNDPEYFSDFIKKANKNGLQYLSDTEISEMYSENYADSIKEVFSKIDDAVEFAQYRDFLVNQRFRKTLLCKSSVQLKRNIDIYVMEDFSFSYAGQKQEINDIDIITEGLPVMFQVGNIQVTHTSVAAKTTMKILNDLGKRTISYHDLCNQVMKKIGETNKEVIKNIFNNSVVLLKLVLHGFLKIHYFGSDHIIEVSKKPKVMDLARYQAKSGHRVSNQLCENIQLDDLQRVLLLTMDGENTEKQIVDLIVSKFMNKELHLKDQNNNIMQVAESEIKRLVKIEYKKHAELFAHHALLVS